MIVPRRFAVATKEVNVEQFGRFVQTNDRFELDHSTLKRYSPDPDGPWIGANWYAATAYCNWLSEQEGLPKSQWCYRANESGAYAEGMTIPANVLEAARATVLPTEARMGVRLSCQGRSLTDIMESPSISWRNMPGI